MDLLIRNGRVVDPANGLDASVGRVDRHDRRLADDDAETPGKNAGVRGSEIDGEVLRESRQHIEHGGSFHPRITSAPATPAGSGEE